MLKLKNGSEEPQSIVITTMIAIKGMENSGMPGLLALSDLLKISRRDPTFTKGGGNEEELKKFALLQEDGQPHGSVRNIVLSALSGEGVELQISSPVAN